MNQIDSAHVEAVLLCIWIFLHKLSDVEQLTLFTAGPQAQLCMPAQSSLKLFFCISVSLLTSVFLHLPMYLYHSKPWF